MKRLLTAICLVLCVSGPVHASGMNPLGSGTNAMRMMEAMWDMMEWFFNQGDDKSASVPWNYLSPSSPWTYAYPGSGWNSRFTNPLSYAQTPGSWGAQSSSPWRDQSAKKTPFDNLSLWSPLDGIWKVTTGEYWIVQGNQFALYGGGNNYVRGTASIQGNHLIAMIPETGATYDFRFWLVEDMLILRDERGNAIVLDLLQPTAGNWQW